MTIGVTQDRVRSKYPPSTGAWRRRRWSGAASAPNAATKIAPLKLPTKNKEIKQLRARINKLNKWIADEAANPTPPTLADVITEILSRQGQSGISKLKAASQMLISLQQNSIADITNLGKMTSAMSGKLVSINEDRKKVQRRINTPKDHIMHSENYKKYRKTKTQYDKLYAEYRAIKKSGRIPFRTQDAKSS